MCFWHQNHGEGNGRLLHHVFLAPKPWRRQRPLAFTVRFATAACLHRVFFGTKTMVKATAACFTMCFWHQNLGEGNGRLPSPCVLQRPLAFAVCFGHQNHGEGNGRPCVFGTKTMVKATAVCFHRVFWYQNHSEGNGRLPSPRVLAPNHGEGNGRLPSLCVFGSKTMVKATAACFQRGVKATAACLHRVFLAPKPW